MNKQTASYYPNSLCFENKNNIKLFNNWFDTHFEVISFDSEEPQKRNKKQEKIIKNKVKQKLMEDYVEILRKVHNE